jgi:ubiquinone/menaquinone biosynthesis C-methylase UbiE
MITHEREGTRAWPVVAGALRRVLDVGCGNGDALARAGTDFVAVGIDIDHDALRTGSELFPGHQLCRAAAEALPFKDGAFDAALSRVALPLMDIPAVLAEIARVVRRDGEVWLAFHRVSYLRTELRKSVRALNLVRTAYLGYVLLNGLVFHFTGKTFRFPLNRAYSESFQTERGVSRALVRAGFHDVRVVENIPLVVTARRA